MLAYSPDAWTEVIVGLSIFVPVVVTIAITVAVLRGARNDPDEQRWRREAERRRRESASDGGR